MFWAGSASMVLSSLRCGPLYGDLVAAVAAVVLPQAPQAVLYRLHGRGSTCSFGACSKHGIARGVPFEQLFPCRFAHLTIRVGEPLG